MAGNGAAMTLSWNDYRSLPDAARRYQECSFHCRAAFEHQRRNISKVIAATRPTTVAVLGAGVMNDVPYGHLLNLQAEVHLIDWLPGAPEAGLRYSLISEDAPGEFSCLYCRPGVDVPGDYCRNYCRLADELRKVCDNFEPTQNAPPQCATFERGVLPVTYCEDVTGGYAETFARQVGRTLRGVQSWRKAIERSVALARKVRGTQKLSLPSHGMDLVTSSMVVSQFEHEPYQFFAQAAEDLLGPPTPSEERTLLKAVSRLRDTLIARQLENHCAEIVRILKPGGRCYMSFELFHEHAASRGSWFLVESTHRALGVLGRRFTFDFDILTPTETAERFSTGETSSLVYSYVLRPRTSSAGESGRPRVK